MPTAQDLINQIEGIGGTLVKDAQSLVGTGLNVLKPLYQPLVQVTQQVTTPITQQANVNVQGSTGTDLISRYSGLQPQQGSVISQIENITGSVLTPIISGIENYAGLQSESEKSIDLTTGKKIQPNQIAFDATKPIGQQYVVVKSGPTGTINNLPTTINQKQTQLSGLNALTSQAQNIAGEIINPLVGAAEKVAGLKQTALIPETQQNQLLTSQTQALPLQKTSYAQGSGLFTPSQSTQPQQISVLSQLQNIAGEIVNPVIEGTEKAIGLKQAALIPEVQVQSQPSPKITNPNTLPQIRPPAGSPSNISYDPDKGYWVNPNGTRANVVMRYYVGPEGSTEIVGTTSQGDLVTRFYPTTPGTTAAGLPLASGSLGSILNVGGNLTVLPPLSTRPGAITPSNLIPTKSAGADYSALLIPTYENKQLPSYITSRAGYYDPTKIGDSQTQALAQQIYNQPYAIGTQQPYTSYSNILAQVLEQQRQTAAESGDERKTSFYLNELEKLVERPVEESAGQHYVDYRSGVETAPNPYEYQGDLAVELLKGAPIKASDYFSPVSGEISQLLPQGKIGLQDYGWTIAEGKSKAGYNFEPALQYLGAAEGLYGPYGALKGGPGAEYVYNLPGYTQYNPTRQIGTGVQTTPEIGQQGASSGAVQTQYTPIPTALLPTISLTEQLSGLPKNQQSESGGLFGTVVQDVLGVGNVIRNAPQEVESGLSALEGAITNLPQAIVPSAQAIQQTTPSTGTVQETSQQQDRQSQTLAQLKEDIANRQGIESTNKQYEQQFGLLALPASTLAGEIKSVLYGSGIDDYQKLATATKLDLQDTNTSYTDLLNQMVQQGKLSYDPSKPKDQQYQFTQSANQDDYNNLNNLSNTINQKQTDAQAYDKLAASAQNEQYQSQFSPISKGAYSLSSGITDLLGGVNKAVFPSIERGATVVNNTVSGFFQNPQVKQAESLAGKVAPALSLFIPAAGLLTPSVTNYLQTTIAQQKNLGTTVEQLKTLQSSAGFQPAQDNLNTAKDMWTGQFIGKAVQPLYSPVPGSVTQRFAFDEYGKVLAPGQSFSPASSSLGIPTNTKMGNGQYQYVGEYLRPDGEIVSRYINYAVDSYVDFGKEGIITEPQVGVREGGSPGATDNIQQPYVKSSFGTTNSILSGLDVLSGIPSIGGFGLPSAQTQASFAKGGVQAVELPVAIGAGLLTAVPAAEYAIRNPREFATFEALQGPSVVEQQFTQPVQQFLENPTEQLPQVAALVALGGREFGATGKYSPVDLNVSKVPLLDLTGKPIEQLSYGTGGILSKTLGQISRAGFGEAANIPTGLPESQYTLAQRLSSLAEAKSRPTYVTNLALRFNPVPMLTGSGLRPLDVLGKWSDVKYLFSGSLKPEGSTYLNPKWSQIELKPAKEIQTVGENGVTYITSEPAVKAVVPYEKPTIQAYAPSSLVHPSSNLSGFAQKLSQAKWSLGEKLPGWVEFGTPTTLAQFVEKPNYIPSARDSALGTTLILKGLENRANLEKKLANGVDVTSQFWNTAEYPGMKGYETEVWKIPTGTKAQDALKIFTTELDELNRVAKGYKPERINDPYVESTKITGGLIPKSHEGEFLDIVKSDPKAYLYGSYAMALQSAFKRGEIPEVDIVSDKYTDLGQKFADYYAKYYGGENVQVVTGKDNVGVFVKKIMYIDPKTNLPVFGTDWVKHLDIHNQKYGLGWEEYGVKHNINDLIEINGVKMMPLDALVARKLSTIMAYTPAEDTGELLIGAKDTKWKNLADTLASMESRVIEQGERPGAVYGINPFATAEIARLRRTQSTIGDIYNLGKEELPEGGRRYPVSEKGLDEAVERMWKQPKKGSESTELVSAYGGDFAQGAYKRSAIASVIKGRNIYQLPTETLGGKLIDSLKTGAGIIPAISPLQIRYGDIEKGAPYEAVKILEPERGILGGALRAKPAIKALVIGVQNPLEGGRAYLTKTGLLKSIIPEEESRLPFATKAGENILRPLYTRIVEKQGAQLVTAPMLGEESRGITIKELIPRKSPNPEDLVENAAGAKTARLLPPPPAIQITSPFGRTISSFVGSPESARNAESVTQAVMSMLTGLRDEESSQIHEGKRFLQGKEILGYAPLGEGLSMSEVGVKVKDTTAITVPLIRAYAKNFSAESLGELKTLADQYQFSLKDAVLREDRLNQLEPKNPGLVERINTLERNSKVSDYLESQINTMSKIVRTKADVYRNIEDVLKSVESVPKGSEEDIAKIARKYDLRAQGAMSNVAFLKSGLIKTGDMDWGATSQEVADQASKELQDVYKQYIKHGAIPDPDNQGSTIHADYFVNNFGDRIIVDKIVDEPLALDKTLEIRDGMKPKAEGTPIDKAFSVHRESFGEDLPWGLRSGVNPARPPDVLLDGVRFQSLSEQMMNKATTGLYVSLDKDGNLWLGTKPIKSARFGKDLGDMIGYLMNERRKISDSRSPFKSKRIEEIDSLITGLEDYSLNKTHPSIKFFEKGIETSSGRVFGESIKDFEKRIAKYPDQLSPHPIAPTNIKLPGMRRTIKVGADLADILNRYAAPVGITAAAAVIAPFAYSQAQQYLNQNQNKERDKAILATIGGAAIGGLINVEDRDAEALGYRIKSPSAFADVLGKSVKEPILDRELAGSFRERVNPYEEYQQVKSANRELTDRLQIARAVSAEKARSEYPAYAKSEGRGSKPVSVKTTKASASGQTYVPTVKMSEYSTMVPGARRQTYQMPYQSAKTSPKSYPVTGTRYSANYQPVANVVSAYAEVYPAGGVSKEYEAAPAYKESYQEPALQYTVPSAYKEVGPSYAETNYATTPKYTAPVQYAQPAVYPYEQTYTKSPAYTPIVSTYPVAGYGYTQPAPYTKIPPPYTPVNPPYNPIITPYTPITPPITPPPPLPILPQQPEYLKKRRKKKNAKPSHFEYAPAPEPGDIADFIFGGGSEPISATKPEKSKTETSKTGKKKSKKTGKNKLKKVKKPKQLETYSILKGSGFFKL